MRQEGQKEQSAHAQSPRPIPFQMDRRLSHAHLRLQEMGGGKHCIQRDQTPLNAKRATDLMKPG